MLYGFEESKPIEFGLYTLGDHLPNPETGKRISEKQRIKDIIRLGIESENAGLDFFSVGESHQEYFASQAHTVILSTIAQATDRIKLGSSSTIISAADPVRVYEDFATLDAISDGRMELVAGRASRVGIFELFGYNLYDYEELYEEKLDLLRQINDNEYITWDGKFRPALNDAHVIPRPDDDRKLKIWRAVGGGPSSAIAAGAQGIPMFMAHLGGPVDSFQYTIDVYRESLSINGYDPRDFPITTAGPLFIAEDTNTAINEFYQYSDPGMIHVNGQGMGKRAYAQAASERSIMNVGEPNLIIDKLLLQYETYGMQRYIGQLDFGGVPFDKQMEMLEVLEAKIVPALKKYTGKKGE